MKIRRQSLEGVALIEPERFYDERGCLTKIWDAREAEAAGMTSRVVRRSVTSSTTRGTLRGMHFQAPPFAEAKLVRCIRGEAYDVVADVRRDSPTFGKWQAFELTAENSQILYIPEGLAHGFQTLVDDTEIDFQISAPHAPDATRGFRWDDPTFAIRWPLPISVMGRRDASYGDFVP